MHPPTAPSSLPVYQRQDEIVEALRRHRVVVVEGPTGSGKTTQVPRILRNVLGVRRVGVTQPRRIAAVSVAWHVAALEGVEVGAEVGYSIRFDDCTSPRTAIKLMTDGILLTEARSDPDLGAYDVIMVDEAHERSLNIDVTLGLLHRLLERRSDLRVVISSATIAPEQFQRFFEDVAGEVAVVSVQARVFPVEIRYLPLPSDHPFELIDTVSELIAHIHQREAPGHVLVFLSGEAAIRRVVTTVEEIAPARDLLLMPLYSRLTREEQERVFEPVVGKRKVVVATNIAETSITIPDVRYVIDSGVAKVPRYNARTGITTLWEEPISKASCDQRAGRAGRTGPGIVWRLFSQDSLAERPDRTEEEIRRLDLAEVVLRLLDLGIDDVETFPFPTPPPRGKVRAALESLRALGAVDEEDRITPMGRRMAPFPLTPSIARMVLEAAERFPRVVDDVLVVAAFLSGRSPFVLPDDDQDRARDEHARLAHPLGDSMTHLRLFRRWQAAADPEAFCRQRFLDPEVMAFAAKAHGQLRDIAASQGVALESGGHSGEVVRAVAAGLADKVIRREGGSYRTLTGALVSLHPGSVLAGRGPDLAVAAELVSYARAYAVNVSAIEPSWLAEVSPAVARQLGLGGRVREPPLREVTLGRLTLPVSSGRGKPTVEVRLEDLPELRAARAEDLPPAARRVRGAVRWTDRHVFAALPLPKLLDAVHRAPFPAPGSRPPRLHTGELIEVDRGRHRLERALGHVLVPGAAGRSAGWVALVANGAGGFWLDVVPHYHDAVTATEASLSDLAERLYEGDPLGDQVRRIEDRLHAAARPRPAPHRGRGPGRRRAERRADGAPRRERKGRPAPSGRAGGSTPRGGDGEGRRGRSGTRRGKPGRRPKR